MNKNINIGIIADDLRQIYMAKHLIYNGFHINLICSDKLESNNKSIIDDIYINNSTLISNANNMYYLIEKSNIIVTPIPFIKVNNYIHIADFISNISLKDDLNTFLLYAGQIDNDTIIQLNERNIKYIDYYQSESLTIFNTIATAEGIIAEAILNKNTNLHNSNTLVLGYGKCAKTLAMKLKGFGANVTICARNKNDLISAESVGYNSLDLHNLIMEISNFEYIFNTIPAPVLNEEILAKVNNESLILDISSLPGGINKAFAANRNLKTIHSLGIPGTCSPKSSGIAVAEDLMKHLR